MAQVLNGMYAVVLASQPVPERTGQVGRPRLHKPWPLAACFALNRQLLIPLLGEAGQSGPQGHVQWATWKSTAPFFGCVSHPGCGKWLECGRE